MALNTVTKAMNYVYYYNDIDNITFLFSVVNHHGDEMGLGADSCVFTVVTDECG